MLMTYVTHETVDSIDESEPMIFNPRFMEKIVTSRTMNHCVPFCSFSASSSVALLLRWNAILEMSSLARSQVTRAQTIMVTIAATIGELSGSGSVLGMIPKNLL